MGESGKSSSSYGFAGEQLDPTGLYFNRARYYNPNLGRFISRDSMMGSLQNPTSLNRFVYTSNNPTLYTDPSGYSRYDNQQEAGDGGAGSGGETATVNRGIFNSATTANNSSIRGSSQPNNPITAFGQGFKMGLDYSFKAFTIGFQIVPENVKTRLYASAILVVTGSTDATAEILYNQASKDSNLANSINQAQEAGVGSAVMDVVDLTISLTPIIGSARSVAEGLTGRTLFGNRELDTGERVGSITLGLASFVLEAGALKGAGKGAESVCSFGDETVVTTDKGEKAISQVAVGDKVLAFDEVSQTNGYYTVTAVLVHSDAIVEYLTVDKEVVETTPEHPFYTREWGWVSAGSLQAGWHVRKADGSYGEVELIEVANQVQVMYNLTVEGAHTFFVGSQKILVHNACEKFERFGSKAEAEQAAKDNALSPRPGHESQPKWIAGLGKVDRNTLGNTKKYYTHRMEIETEAGTGDWLKQFEIKPDNEPGRYAIPANQLDEFNKMIKSITSSPIKKRKGH